ncbi:hypothetical protein ACFVFJ_37165 [Streptomyces sp. NPDC057717]|uniref:hypothetical protein n=1 Tax=Streptomyces sp. NPDC057717 TaxID=3346224 RepID=UPI00367A3149
MPEFQAVVHAAESPRQAVVWVPSRHNEAIAAFAKAVAEGLVAAGHHIADKASNG